MSSLMRFSLILSLSCLLTIVGCVTEPESDTINIHVRGTVTSEVNGSPIDSAQIILYDFYYVPIMPIIIDDHNVWIETYTDSFGFYEIKEGIPPLPDRFELELKALKPGYPVIRRRVEWSEDVQILNFQLYPDTPLP